MNTNIHTHTHTHLKVSAAPYEGAGAEPHEADQQLEHHPRQRGRAVNPAHAGPGRQEVLPHAVVRVPGQMDWTEHTPSVPRPVHTHTHTHTLITEVVSD